MVPSITIDQLIGVALQAAFVVGCTGVAAKFITAEVQRNIFLPLIALLLGVVATTSDLWLPTGVFELVAKGVALGGSATGLYAIRSESKKEANVAIAAAGN